MNEFHVNLLPPEALRHAGIRLRRRIVALAATAFAVTLAGLAAHSFNESRSAAIRVAVAQDLRESAQSIDDVHAMLMAEREHLRRLVACQQTVALPAQASDVIATISHLLPEGVSLHAMKISISETKAPTARGQAQPAPSNQASQPKPVTLDVALAGHSMTLAAVSELEQRLGARAPFVSVRRNEVKQAGSGEQAFSLTVRVDPWAQPDGAERIVSRSMP